MSPSDGTKRTASRNYSTAKRCRRKLGLRTYASIDARIKPNDWMTATLGTGARRLPPPLTPEGIFASSIPMPHVSVMPEKTNPAPTVACNSRNSTGSPYVEQVDLSVSTEFR